MNETQLLGTDGEIPTNNKEKVGPLLLLASPIRLETKLVFIYNLIKSWKRKIEDKWENIKRI